MGETGVVGCERVQNTEALVDGWLVILIWQLRNYISFERIRF